MIIKFHVGDFLGQPIYHTVEIPVRELKIASHGMIWF